MNQKEIEYNIKKQNFIGRSLWVIYNERKDRSNMLVDFYKWEGAGEYKCVEFPEKNKMYFVHSNTFRKLRLTCQNCGSKLKDDNNFLKKEGVKNKFICNSCDYVYESEYEQPLKLVNEDLA